jgi:predicted nucleic acid-binding protein
VLTEAFHFAVERGNFRQAIWNFVHSTRVSISPVTDADLPAIEMLMARYADRPMDFADATLVHVAEREGINTVFTVDHSDFETYRIGRGAKFRILPAR